VPPELRRPTKDPDFLNLFHADASARAPPAVKTRPDLQAILGAPGECRREPLLDLFLISPRSVAESGRWSRPKDGKMMPNRRGSLPMTGTAPASPLVP
jgi:hypothetical protein